jgi:predicted small lipoprotein YifL
MPHNEIIRHLLAASALVTALVLGGCGQKGDLYLPEKPAALASTSTLK